MNGNKFFYNLTWETHMMTYLLMNIITVVLASLCRLENAGQGLTDSSMWKFPVRLDFIKGCWHVTFQAVMIIVSDTEDDHDY